MSEVVTIVDASADLILTMAREYIERKMQDSIDRAAPSGLLETSIGIGPAATSLSHPLVTSDDDVDGLGTISAKHIRGRPKVKAIPSPSTEQPPSSQFSPKRGISKSDSHSVPHWNNTSQKACSSHSQPTTPRRFSKSKSQDISDYGSSSREIVASTSSQSSMFYLFENVKQRLASVSSYSNVLNGFGLLPQFARRERSRSRSASRSGSKSRPRGRSSSDAADDDFVFVENIELHHFNGFVYGSRHEVGKGHRFKLLMLDTPTWCDYCGDFVWGIAKQCLRCQNCNYTCHHKCRQHVSLDCAAAPGGSVSGIDDASVASGASIASGSSSGSGVGGAYRRQSSRTSETSLSENTSRVEDAESGYHTGDSLLQHRVNAAAKNKTTPTKSAHPHPTSSPAHAASAPEPATPDAPPRPKGWAPSKSISPPGGAVRKEPSNRTLNRQELAVRIEAFNKNQHGLPMTLTEDQCGRNEDTCPCYQGFIRVYMQLTRPISMVLPSKAPSLTNLTGDALIGSTASLDRSSLEETGEITSFYLPKDTTKAIHINSETSAHEVIKILLTKFYITDNPHKFALYEKVTNSQSEVTMKRLSDTDEPLPLCLSWTAEGLNNHQFVLQDNDTEEVMWDAFSTPELETFLRILSREENEYLEQVRSKYQLLRIQMNRRLEELRAEKKVLLQAMDATDGGLNESHS